MSTKKYPHTVTLRPLWKVVGFILIVLVIGSIGYNMINSENRILSPQNNEEEDNVRTVATTEDTSWYQAATIQKAVHPLITVATTSQKLPHITEHSTLDAQSPDNTSAESTSHDDAEIQKAMSAPISSNQITFDIPSHGSSTSENTESAILTTHDKATDLNQQSEKLAFLETKSSSSEGYLLASVKNPLSPYEVQTGTIIPIALYGGINSDLPGQVTARVTSNVYDTVSGHFLLIPQGSQIIGLYDSQVTYGQQRVLVVWNWIKFPNGQSLNLQGMPGADRSGYAGLHDVVNNHLGKVFISVIAMTAFTAAAQLSQPKQSNNPFAAPTISQTLAQSLGTNIANTGTALINKNLNIQPTLQIRPAYESIIRITHDVVFPGPYSENRSE